MRKVICLSLCLIMALLTGCTSAKTQPEAPMVQHTQETPLPEKTAPASTAQESKTFSRGSLNGQTYTSAFAGLTVTLPQGWGAANALQLEAISEYDESNTLICLTDLSAQNDQTGESIIVMFENLSRSKEAAAVTTEEYAAIIAEGLCSSEEFTYSILPTEAAALCGQEFLCVHAAVSEYEVEQLYCLRREGDMMLIVILTGADAQALTAYFEP